MTLEIWLTNLGHENLATLAELGTYSLICEIIMQTTKYLFHIVNREKGILSKKMANSMMEDHDGRPDFFFFNNRTSPDPN